MTLRRDFLIKAPLGLLAVSTASGAAALNGELTAEREQVVPPGAPPTFGAAPPTGPTVSSSTFAEAEKLMQVNLSLAERAVAAASWQVSMASLQERRTGPRKIAIADSVAPATVWRPLLSAPIATSLHKPRYRGSGNVAAEPLPTREDDIAFAPVTSLSRWIASRALSSERLTRIYLARIARLDTKLRSVITITSEHAIERARLADREIAVGKYRGPLHGIPYGVKDLLDTAGIPTTWGAEPLRNNVPTRDSAVVARLNAAGAVLIAKLSMGALALNDIWFGGQTMNPWLLDEGASGSSAGPGAATAAGLVAFSIGSETEGSIVSPATRCGITGLRPTYGRVPRTGAMTLCWSLDKLGPMTRSVEDAMMVLAAINGADELDAASVDAPLEFNSNATVRGLKIGYFPNWMKEAPAVEVDRNALSMAVQAGMHAVPVSLPDWPYQSLNTILFAEAGAAFEEWALDRRLEQLKVQVADAWPNLLRQARFISAVDFVQADRLRRMVAAQMARIFQEVDLLLVPSLRDEMLTISNFTGHPSLTLRTGSVEVSQARSDWAPDPANPMPTFAKPRRVPHGVTLIGRLFDEGTIARAAMALERSAGVASERPPGF